MPEEEKDKDKCPKCGSTKTEVRPYGFTGTLAEVRCAECGAYIREWNAY